MMKTQIGLGVLSIPLAFDTLGMVPGVLCLLAIAIITTWSDYIIGVFKINHPEVYVSTGTAFVAVWLTGPPFSALTMLVDWLPGNLDTGSWVAYSVYVSATTGRPSAFTNCTRLGFRGWLSNA